MQIRPPAVQRSGLVHHVGRRVPLTAAGGRIVTTLEQEGRVESVVQSLLVERIGPKGVEPTHEKHRIRLVRRLQQLDPFPWGVVGLVERRRLGVRQKRG